jgi:hypothetical protein
LRLFGVHLIDGGVCAERENGSQTQGCDDNCAFHNLFSNLNIFSGGRLYGTCAAGEILFQLMTDNR